MAAVASTRGRASGGGGREGAAAGSPIRRSPSAHAAIVAISASDSQRASWYVLQSPELSVPHGGICRVRTIAGIEAA
jgi:hypothetical protein